MRKVMLLAVLALAPMLAIAAPELPILDPARVTEKTLPDGLKLIVKEERQWPVVALGAYIRAGSRQELASEVGAAHLVEHLLFEATGDDSQKLAPFIESMGGRIGATTMRDFVHVDLIISSKYLERVLPVFVKAIFQAGFTEQQMLREQAVVKREISDRRERADLYLDEMIWSLAYDKHPYGHPIGGTVADVDKLTYDLTNQFYRRFYVPNNASILAVGDVDPGWLEGRLKELTVSIPSKEIAWHEPALDPPLTETRVKAESVNREISLLAFGWRAADMKDKPAVCTLDLVYTILGQEGAGRLNSRLVDDQKVLLTSDVSFLTQKQPGLFLVTALVQPGREEEAQAAIVKEVTQLAAEPVTDEELARAKRLLYAEYAFTNESYDDQVGSMGFYASLDSYRFALEYIDQVMKITPAQLQDVARRLLRADNYSLAILRGQKGERPDTAAMLP
jgi:zinc protease